MNSRKSSRSSGWPGSLSPLLGILAVVVIGGLGTIALLSFTGFFQQRPAGPDRRGMVAVPKSVRPIKAYTKVTREDVYDRAIGDDSYYWMPADRVKANPDWFVNLNRIVGRVMAVDKEEGYVFSEKNFLPEGTRPGVTGGIPPGKRSLSVPVDGIVGLDALSAGDEFDLLAAGKSKPRQTGGVDLAALLGGVRPPELRISQRVSSDGLRVLVQQGTLVAAAEATDAKSKDKKKPSATVAVAPEEVASLAEAISSDQPIYCIARSGQPVDETAGQEFASMIAVPVLGRPVAAYEQINEAHLADPATGRLNVYYFDPQRIDESWLRKPQQIIGRVVGRSMPPGHLITEADLMPPGTRPGIAAGAAPGKRVYVAPANRIDGLSGLSVGNVVSLYATLGDAVDAPPPKMDWASIMGGMPEPGGLELQNEVRAGVRAISRDAKIVMIDRPSDSVAFAIESDEVISMSQAINSNQQIFAVAVSSKDSNAVPQQSTNGESVIEASKRYLSKKPSLVSINSVERSAGPGGSKFDSSFVPEQGRQTKFTRSNSQRSAATRPDDWIAVPVTGRSVTALERLKIEDFVEPSTGQARLYYFPPDSVSDDWVRDLPSLVDRVVRRNVDVGRVLKKSDLLPVGSRPGPTAGLPPGYRAITVDSDQVTGLELLREGDVIDLVECIPVDMDGTVRFTAASRDRLKAPIAVPKVGGLNWAAEVNVVARGVRLVRRVTEKRQELIDVKTENAAKEIVTATGVERVGVEQSTQPTVIEREITMSTLALMPEQVPAVTATLTAGGQLFAAAQSGEAGGDNAGDLVPNIQANVHRVEHIRGSDRTTETFVGR